MLVAFLLSGGNLNTRSTSSDRAKQRPGWKGISRVESGDALLAITGPPHSPASGLRRFGDPISPVQVARNEPSVLECRHARAATSSRCWPTSRPGLAMWLMVRETG